MAEIIPAILPKSFDDLRDHLARVRGVSSVVQIDVVDGRFAPNLTWPYSDRESFERIVREEEGLPYWEDFDFEIDLMTVTAKRDALLWVKAGAARLIIHAESPDAREALQALETYRGLLDVGVALGMDTPLQKLDEFEGMYSFVQLMGIGKVGFQGEPFDGRIYERIRALRALDKERIISIDGGVTFGNAGELLRAGATRLAAGSAIFKADDIQRAYEKLSNI